MSDKRHEREARLEGGGSIYKCQCGRCFGTHNALSVHEHTCLGDES